MKTVSALIRRNIKLFFKDKGMFFTALITPAILLVLYASFLSNVYRDTFLSSLPQGLTLAEDLLDGLVGGQLISSLLAVSCVTVAFCSNFLMVQDKASGVRRDFLVSPAPGWALAVGYYLATLASTLLVCLGALGICLGYVALVGWYMTAGQVLLLLLDVVLLTLFGTAFSSVVNGFLSTQGQISAVGTVISAGYGFLCGAYMPISSFGQGLQKVLSFLPGTYGTSLMRNHAMGGVLEEMVAQGLPVEAMEGLRDGLDCNLYFLGESVPVPVMYAIVALSTLVLMGLYVVLQTRVCATRPGGASKSL